MNKKNVLFKLWHQLSSKRKAQFIFINLLSILSAIIEVVSVGELIPFITILTSNGDINKIKYLNRLLNIKLIGNNNKLLTITIIFCILLFISGVLKNILLWVQNKFSFSVGTELSYKAFKNILHQPYLNQISQNSGHKLNTLTKVNNLVNLTISPVLNIISSILILFLLLLSLFIYNPFATLIILLGFSMIYLLIISKTKKRVKSNSIKISFESNSIQKNFQESLGATREIIINNLQEVYCKLFLKSEIPLRKAQLNLAILGGSPRFIIETLGLGFIAVISYLLTINNYPNVIATIGVLALGIQRMMPLYQQLYVGWNTLKGNQASCEDALILLEENKFKKSFTNHTSNFNNCLTLTNVSFKYPNKNEYILKNISIKINKGDKVGIVGETGSGKSTFLDLISGLLDPTNGKIEIDGEDTGENNIKIKNIISYVPQHIYLTDSTIAENIAFGVEKINIDYKLVKEVSKKAKISDTIEKLPNNYNTIIGERGVFLSGGQRQRVGIARALYKNSKILIFDEATSALDNETEIEVMREINKLNEDLTILIVAHRTTTLKQCDYILNLKNSSIYITDKV